MSCVNPQQIVYPITRAALLYNGEPIPLAESGDYRQTTDSIIALWREKNLDPDREPQRLTGTDADGDSINVSVERLMQGF